MRIPGIAGLLSLVSLLLVACAASPQPPTPTPQPTAAAPASRSMAAPAVSPEDAAWNKVVEAAKREGVVVPYSFAMTGDVGRAVAAAFQEKYGIKVEIVTGVGVVLMERIRSEMAADRFIADTYDTAPTFVAIAKKDGLTQSVGDIPELREQAIWTAPPAADSERHVISFSVNYNTPYVNTTQIKSQDEPLSFNDLLSPSWKGKIVVGDPMTDPQLPRLYVAATKYGSLNDDYFRALARQTLKTSPTVRDADSAVVRGEASLRLPGSYTSFAPLIKDGAPMKPLNMSEGTILVIATPIALLKKAPHPNATRVFINWLLSKEGQTVYHRVRGTQPIRKDVLDYTVLQAQVQPKKTWAVDLDMENEVGRVQRELVVQKLMGLDKR